MTSLELYSLARVVFEHRPDVRLWTRDTDDGVLVWAEQRVSADVVRGFVRVPREDLGRDDEKGIAASLERLRRDVGFRTGPLRATEAMRRYSEQVQRAAESLTAALTNAGFAG